MTLKVPGVAPAVYNPPEVIVPPVATYVTVGAADDPSLHVPETANWPVTPGWTVMLPG